MKEPTEIFTPARVLIGGIIAGVIFLITMSRIMGGTLNPRALMIIGVTLLAFIVILHIGIRIMQKIYPSDTGIVKKQYSLAKSYVERGMYQEAIEEYKKEAYDDPSDIYPFYAIAEIYHNYLKSPESALRNYEIVIAKSDNPNIVVSALDHIGNIYAELGRKDKQLIIYKRILDEYPDHPLSERAQIIINSLKK